MHAAAGPRALWNANSSATLRPTEKIFSTRNVPCVSPCLLRFISRRSLPPSPTFLYITANNFIFFLNFYLQLYFPFFLFLFLILEVSFLEEIFFKSISFSYSFCFNSRFIMDLLYSLWIYIYYILNDFINFFYFRRRDEIRRIA